MPINKTPDGPIGNIEPSFFYIPVTPHATDELPRGLCRAIYVGGAGDLDIVNSLGETVTFAGVTAGSLYPIRTKRVLNSSTATDIVALY